MEAEVETNDAPDDDKLAEKGEQLLHSSMEDVNEAANVVVVDTATSIGGQLSKAVEGRAQVVSSIGGLPGPVLVFSSLAEGPSGIPSGRLPSPSPSGPPPGQAGLYLSIKRGRRMQAAKSLWGPPKQLTWCGSLYNEGDSRPLRCYLETRLDQKKNVMFSFDPYKLSCGCCGPAVLARGLIQGDNDRRVFVLSDQNFSACAPTTGGGQGLKVIRLEDGGLLELLNLYTSWLRRLSLRLPVGSIVLIGLASHLVSVGLAAYAEELGVVCGKLHGFHEGGVHVLPAPMLLLDGTTNPSLVASLAEVSLNSVFSASDAVYSNAAVLAVRLVTEAGLTPVVFHPPRRLMMPSSMLSSVKRSWSSGGASLPGHVAPLSKLLEAEILGSLIEDLNSSLSLGLDPKLNLSRDTTAGGPGQQPTIIIIGGSNADMTGLALMEPGWHAIKAKVDRMAGLLVCELAKHEGDKIAVVFQLLDNSFFMARTEEGSLIPTRKELGGSYHVDGDLVMAPKEMQFHNLSTIRLLLEAAGNLRKVLVAPIPRYLLQPCCQDARHIANMRGTPEDSIFQSRRNVRDFVFRLGIRNIKVLGPLQDLRKLGDSMWASPVHMSKAGYRCLAGLIESSLVKMSMKQELPGVTRGKKRGRDLY